MVINGYKSEVYSPTVLSYLSIIALFNHFTQKIESYLFYNGMNPAHVSYYSNNSRTLDIIFNIRKRKADIEVPKIV